MPNPDNITAPILVIGPGRSGSSWLVHALNQHPDVHALIENQWIDAIHREIFESWWSSDWHWVCNQEVLKRRAVQVARRTMCILFPGDQPHWVMKAIWKGRPWDFFRQVFPDARYIHITRSPCTAAPSMMEYLGRKNPAWRKLSFAEEQYVCAHREALTIRDAGLPYLLIRQEEAATDPANVWQRVREFCGLTDVPVRNLEKEINVSSSTAGRVREGRDPIPWAKFSSETIAVARELGYEPERESGVRLAALDRGKA